MNNRLEQLLAYWFDKKDDHQWVLATIYETQGSAYRKAGARMLINSNGQSFGLLSGGCLEADLMRKAQKCLSADNSLIVVYDMQDDADIAWQLGIGCGGVVKVLLQPINKANNYQDLPLLRERLNNRQSCYYQQDIPVRTLSESQSNKVHTLEEFEQISQPLPTNIFSTKVTPKPAIAILGAGIDAQPVVSIAHTLGWHISLFDSRVNYGRAAYFQHADKIIKRPYQELHDCELLMEADVIIIMNHNITLDAEALLISEKSQARYIGMLGPTHRTDKVLAKAGLALSDLKKPFYNPIGLDLGGELPESIALSIMSQAHSTVEQASALPLNHQIIEHNITSKISSFAS
ncbi:XdhC family protein [Colwellia sp. RSH04]|uniref:XdhC family protein n=1 Tax=Colwellia sp. RSH04 TaxID=2305464 RepID=UPI000E58B6F6|nr:XdhC family protein [Colwellia sp. RSH04]RHW78056.1 XdhC family protein [Colwellia sp. RSH04]